MEFVGPVVEWSWWIPVWFRWAAAAVGVLVAVLLWAEQMVYPPQAVVVAVVVPVGLMACWLVGALAWQVATL